MLNKYSETGKSVENFFLTFLDFSLYKVKGFFHKMKNRIHYKERLAVLFSDIPAGDGKIANLFYSVSMYTNEMARTTKEL